MRERVRFRVRFGNGILTVKFWILICNQTNGKTKRRPNYFWQTRFKLAKIGFDVCLRIMTCKNALIWHCIPLIRDGIELLQIKQISKIIECLHYLRKRKNLHAKFNWFKENACWGTIWSFACIIIINTWWKKRNTDFFNTKKGPFQNHIFSTPRCIAHATTTDSCTAQSRAVSSPDGTPITPLHGLKKTKSLQMAKPWLLPPGTKYNRKFILLLY